MVLGYSSSSSQELKRSHLLNEEQGIYTSYLHTLYKVKTENASTLRIGLIYFSILNFNLNLPSATWFGSLAALGAVLGGPIAGYLSDKTGRRGSVIYGALPYIGGWVAIICGSAYIQSTPSPYILFYIGRILTGIGMGMSSMSVPLYIAEVSSKEYRGMLGTLLQLTTVGGLLLAYILGIWLRAYWLAVASMVPVTLMVISMAFMPETPRWLVKYSNEDEAFAALEWLRGQSPDNYSEYKEIKETIEAQAEEKTVTISDLKKPSFYKPIVISLGLMLFMQFSGINAVLFYADEIFSKTNIPQNLNALPSIIIGVTEFIFTFIASLIIDRTGRKVLLVVSCSVMTLSSVTFGVYYYLLNVHHVTSISWLSLVSIGFYIAGFALGIGPIPWLIMSEVFPVRTRGIGISAAVFLTWSCAFLVTKTFASIVALIGYYWTLWVFACVTLAAIFFVVFVVLETKGKSLEEIEAYFNRRTL